MQRAPTVQVCSEHERSAVGCMQQLGDAARELIQQVLLGAQFGDVEVELLPADDVDGMELRMHRAVVTDFDDVDAARPALVRVPPLRIAGIDHGRRGVAQHLPRMHVAERPIVDSAA